MTENERFTNVWCSETGQIGLTDYGVVKTFTCHEFEDFLNSLNEVPAPIVLDTHISQEDFDNIERMIIKQFDSHSEMHSINRIHALQRENERLKQRNPFNKVMLTRAINKKIDDVMCSIEYGDISRGCRIFAQHALIELKEELGL